MSGSITHIPCVIQWTLELIHHAFLIDDVWRCLFQLVFFVKCLKKGTLIKFIIVVIVIIYCCFCSYYCCFLVLLLSLLLVLLILLLI